MATVHIAIGYCKGVGVGGASVPVRTSVISRSAVMTSSGSSQVCSLTATQAEIDNGALWFVTVSGGAIDVNCGLVPVAVSTASHRILDGGERELSIGAVGEKLAIKDA